MLIRLGNSLPNNIYLKEPLLQIPAYERKERKKDFPIVLKQNFRNLVDESYESSFGTNHNWVSLLEIINKKTQRHTSKFILQKKHSTLKRLQKNSYNKGKLLTIKENFSRNMLHFTITLPQPSISYSS